MSRILVSPLSAVEDTIRRFSPSHMVTLLSPEHMIETPACFNADRHLRLGVNDIVDVTAGTAPPAKAHIAQLLKFSRQWNPEAPFLIHCWAGVSRSMAGAYTILCDLAGPGNEAEIARAMRRRAPYALPNTLMVQLADDALGRQGRMIEAVRSLGTAVTVTEGVCTEFPLSGL